MKRVYIRETHWWGVRYRKILRQELMTEAERFQRHVAVHPGIVCELVTKEVYFKAKALFPPRQKAVPATYLPPGRNPIKNTESSAVLATCHPYLPPRGDN